MTTAGNNSVSTEGEKGTGQAGSIQGFSLILVSTLTVMALIVLAPVLPQLMVAFHDVPNAGFWVPALISVAGLGAAIFAPFAGFVGDRFGRRIPLIGCCIAFTIFGCLPLVLDDFTAIFISRLALGIAYTGILVLSTALITDCFSGESRSRWFGGQALAATSSALVFLPLGGVLGEWLGWRGPFLTFLVGLPFALTYWIFFRDLREEEELSASRDVGWSALPWRWLMGVNLVSVLVAMLTFAVQLQIGLALAAVGITDAARIGFLSGIAFIGIPAGALLFMRVALWPFGRLLRLQLLVLGATLMMLRSTGDYRAFLAVVFINLIAGGMVLPTFITYVTQRLDGPVRARGIGVWQAAFPVGQFLAVGVTSLIMSSLGIAILDAFWVLGAIGVAAAAIGWLAVPLGKRNAGAD